MIGPGELLLQMHKSAGKLDQPFIEVCIRPGLCKPQVLKDIVRFVVLSGIEAREETGVARIEPVRHWGGELADEVADTVTLFHRGMWSGHYSPLTVRDKMRLNSESVGLQPVAP